MAELTHGDSWLKLQFNLSRCGALNGRCRARRPRGERPSPRAIANLPSGTAMFDIYRTRPKFLVKHDFVRHRSNTHFSPHEEPDCRRHWETSSGSIAWKRAIPWTN